MAKRNIFCANDQEVTVQTLTVDPVNGEILSTCPCGRVLKFPSTVTAESFTELITAHHEGNLGQVSLADTEKLVDSLGDPTLDDETQGEPAPAEAAPNAPLAG